MNTEKTNTLGSADQSVPSRRPLEVALNELAGTIDRAHGSLDQLVERLEPIATSIKQIATSGVDESTAEDTSAVVHYLNNQIIRVGQLVGRIGSIYARLDV